MNWAVWILFAIIFIDIGAALARNKILSHKIIGITVDIIILILIYFAVKGG